MKNKTYIAGLVSVILIALGGVFKIQHFPGAGILLCLGILSICCIFFPMGFLSAYRNSESKNGLVYIAAFLMGIFLFVGAMFKIMHWPGASILLIVATLFPVIVFLPVYIFHYIRLKEESIKNFMYIIFLMVFISGMASLLAVNVSFRIINDEIVMTNLMDLTRYYEIKGLNAGTTQIETNENTEALINYIDDLKTDLLLESSPDNVIAIKDKGNYIIWNILTKDQSGMVNSLMINREKANQLKEKLHSLSTQLTGLTNDQSKAESIGNLLNTQPVIIGERQFNWEKANFENQLLIITFCRLTEIQNNIRLAGSLVQ